MTPISNSSSDRYIREQIDIMTQLLTQMCDTYAIARIRIQLWNLQSERARMIAHTTH